MQAGLERYLEGMPRICFSMSLGRSPTGTFVNPGKSTSVSVRTLGEKIRKLMGCGEMPSLLPSWPPYHEPSRNESFKIITLFIREMKEFASFILINSWVRTRGGG